MKSEQPSSFLEDEGQPETKIPKQQNQFKALFYKNALLQSKQKGTNVCQIITPVICLIFTYLIKTVAEDGFKVNFQYETNKYPYKFNDFKQYDAQNTNKTTGIPARYDKLQYYLYECDPQFCDSSFLGSNNGNQTQKSGLLGDVNVADENILYFPQPYSNNEFNLSKNVPFFTPQDSVDDQIFRRLGVMGNNSFQIIKKQKGLDYLPDGAFKFHQLNKDSLNAQIKVNDVRDLQSHRINGISKNRQIKHVKNEQGFDIPVIDTQFTGAYGLLNTIHLLTSSFIKNVKDKTLKAGYLLMPQAQNSFIDTLINSIAGLIYPLGLSLLFPVFLYSIVLEKQERLVQMMKMNGLKIRYYWLTFFVFNLLLCAVTNLLFYLLGTFVLDGSFFTKTSKILLFLISLGWSLAQIGMAAFFQTFLNKSRSANIIGYLFSIWTTMIAATLNLGSYQFPSQLPIGLQIIPPFAFVRCYYLMMMQCSSADCFYDMGLLSSQIKTCITFLYIGFIVFFLLGVYLFQVIPQQFGVRRSPLFPFYSIAGLFKKNRSLQINTSTDSQLRDYISQHEEDDFSKKQRQKVINFSTQEDQQIIKNQYPLIINNMRKLYKKQGIQGMYAAVRSFNLAIAKRQTFGLLGPNGAGKTTLISMITGMYEPNNGNAWIGGFDIQTNIEKAQLQMGVCPQFDLVWPQLSVSDHLYFYARLKGIPQKFIKQQVEASIKQVKLEKFSNFAAKQLSGGMKRRLSVAISLVGDPKIVFLDEPSSGLDPENRRQLWAVLAECQTKRALFITTHMMQEADTLCNRVGIITSGVLRTIQTPIKLKKSYGQGYDVIINTVKQQRQLISQESLHLGIEEESWFNEEKKIRNSIGGFIQNEAAKNQHLNKVNKNIVEFMKKQFPGTFLFKHFNGYLIFKVPLTYKISTLFETMNLVEKQLGFSDIAITNSSLEDVFMKVVQKFDSQEKNSYPYNADQFQKNQGGSSSQEINQSKKFVSVNKSSEKYKSIDPNQREDLNEKEAQKGNENFQSIISKKRESILSEHEARQHAEQNAVPKASLKHSDDQSDQYF